MSLLPSAGGHTSDVRTNGCCDDKERERVSDRDDDTDAGQKTTQ